MLVDEGRVLVNGKKVTAGYRVLTDDLVTVDGQEIVKEEESILLAFHKPKGIVCTTGHYKDNIIDYIHYPKRIYPIGRLDKDSTGLILLTNRGDLVNGILKGSNYHEKEYIVTVNKDLTPEFLHGMSAGVPILDTRTRPCEITALGRRTFRIVLTQGLNRQIRRMCEYFDYRVRELKRVRVMNITLGDLPEGSYRQLSAKEYSDLLKLLHKD